MPENNGDEKNLVISRSMNTDAIESKNLLSLPVEIILSIFSYLIPEQAALLLYVNRKIREILKTNPFFWHEKSKIHIGHANDDFSKLYREEYPNIWPEVRKLFSYIKERDFASIKNSAIFPCYLLTKDKHGVFLIEWAKKLGDQDLLDYFYVEVRKAYLSYDGFMLDVKKKSSYGKTILHWAILLSQDIQTIECLIIAGAQVNAENEFGEIPLLLAEKENRLDIVKVLINHKADVNALFAKGIRPLFYAVLYGKYDFVKVLMAAGAELYINLKNKDPEFAKFPMLKVGDDPLRAAIRLGHFAIAQALLEENPRLGNIRDLMLAIECKAIGIATMILQAGIDVNTSVYDGSSPLLLAIEMGSKKLVKLLLDFNADMQVYLKRITPKHLPLMIGDAPIHAAAKLGRKEIAKLLLEKGTAVDHLTKNRITPLMYAAQYGHIKVVKLLLMYQAQVDAQTLTGATALTYAVESGQLDIVQLLLERQANCNLPLTKTDSSLEFCEAGNRPLHIAISQRSRAIVNALLNSGAEVNVLDGKMQTALHSAVELNDLEMVKSLLKHNASIKVLNHEGKSPLDLAKGRIRALLELAQYINELDARKKEYAHSIKFLGHEFLNHSISFFGVKKNFSKTQKLAGAKYLHRKHTGDIVKRGEESKHEAVVNNGRLMVLNMALKR